MQTAANVGPKPGSAVILPRSTVRRLRSRIICVLLVMNLLSLERVGLGASLLGSMPPASPSTPSPVGIVFGGQVQQFTHPPLIESGVTLVSLADWARVLKADAVWDRKTGYLRLQRSGRVAELRLGRNVMRVRGRRAGIRKAPRLAGDLPLVPLRETAEALGHTVTWRGAARVITVDDPDVTLLPPARFLLGGASLSTPVPLALDGGQLLFPARQVLEALGYPVKWHAGERRVSFRRHGVRASLSPADRFMMLNGRQVSLTTPPRILANRAYLPLEVLTAAGEAVVWESGAWRLHGLRDPVPTAVLGGVAGGAEVVRKGGGQTEPARPGLRLAAGDRLQTSAGVTAEVVMDDGSHLWLSEDSRLEILTLESDARDASRSVVIRLLQGRLVAKVAPLVRGNSRFEVVTPSGWVSVRGTVFAVAVQPGGRTIIAGLSGEVAVSGGPTQDRHTVLISSRQETVLASPDVAPLPPRPLGSITIDAWARQAVEAALVQELVDNLPPELPAPADGADLLRGTYPRDGWGEVLGAINDVLDLLHRLDEVQQAQRPSITDFRRNPPRLAIGKRPDRVERRPDARDPELDGGDG